MVMMDGLFGDVRAGEVRLVGCADVSDIVDRLRTRSEQHLTGDRFVLCAWEEVPETVSILDSSVEALARTALALWPQWYGREAERMPRPEDERFGSQFCPEILPSGVLPSWLEAAAFRCRAGQLPSLPKFTTATQVSQLSSAIEPAGLYVALAVFSPMASPHRLRDLARAAEWLAREGGTRVLVVVPRQLTGSPGLESVSFQAIDLSATQPPPPPPTQEKRSLLVSPFMGKPHPDSEGEQLIAARLDRDAELSGIFQFNQPIGSVRDNLFVVDLVWQEGKVVVEVDGYHWHGRPEPFQRDRQRDYELLISGYVVLRLTHDEILEDVELAVEKIRDVVSLRRLDS